MKKILFISIILALFLANDAILLNIGSENFGAISKTVMYNGNNPYFLTGNLGIGTASPSYTLDVSGTTRITGATTLSSTLGVTGSSTLTDLNISDTLTSVRGNITNITTTGSSTLNSVRSRFWSNDGTIGETKTCSTTAAFIIKNGLVTSCTTD